MTKSMINKAAMNSRATLSIFVFLIVSTLFAVLLLAPTIASARASSSVRDGIGMTTDEPVDAGRVESAVSTAVDVFSIIVGVVSVIMIIIGGLKYITSNGDSSSISSAKNTILYAVIGLVIVVLAQAIVIFVLDEVDGNGGGATPDDEEDSSLVVPRPYV